VKVVLGFALLATVVWLAWLIGRVAGGDGVVRLLGFLVAVSLATWIAGTWALRLEARRTTRALAAALALLVASGSGIVALRFDTDAPTETAVPAGYAAWSPDAVRASLADDRVVFVDVTADWCITCQVNETLVLGGGPVAAALASDGVAPLVADWTRRDERIRAELARHGRAGVPLYLVISPNDPDAPEVLPEVLTEAIVLDALRRAAPRGDDST
jgi:thiol:disulfide interchange protein DsbD